MLGAGGESGADLAGDNGGEAGCGGLEIGIVQWCAGPGCDRGGCPSMSRRLTPPT
jgi:hypothetical protein